VENIALDDADALIRRVTEYEAKATKGPWLSVWEDDGLTERISEQTEQGNIIESAAPGLTVFALRKTPASSSVPAPTFPAPSPCCGCWWSGCGSWRN
jgi:hypothetical protein